MRTSAHSAAILAGLLALGVPLAPVDGGEQRPGDGVARVGRRQPLQDVARCPQPVNKGRTWSSC